MRLLLIIILFCFSCLSFGQDSLQVDTAAKLQITPVKDTFLSDSSTLKTIQTKKKNQRKKVEKFKTKEVPTVSIEDDKGNIESSRKDNMLIIAGLLIVAAVIITLVISNSKSADNKSNVSSKDYEFPSDYLSRLFLSRREYYRNVYLKSEEWKRKRYVVLKRDNWRCVYCGRRATQVHHTRYAKWNIGKEPIEWLVSICKSCHDSIHQ